MCTQGRDNIEYDAARERMKEVFRTNYHASATCSPTGGGCGIGSGAVTIGLNAGAVAVRPNDVGVAVKFNGIE